MIKDAMMPFGSMANSYGLVNKGKCPSIDVFLQDMELLMELAEKFCEPKKNDEQGTRASIPESEKR